MSMVERGVMRKQGYEKGGYAKGIYEKRGLHSHDMLRCCSQHGNHPFFAPVFSIHDLGL